MKKKYIISGIVFILLLFIYLFYNSITYGNEVMVFTSSSSSDTIKKLLQAGKDGGTIDITSSEINGILEIYKGNINNKQKYIKIERILCNMENGSIEFFIPAKILKINSLISMKGNISYKDNNFIIIPDYIKVGKIKISKKLFFDKLKDIGNDKIKFKDNMIIINSEILPIDVKDFKLNQNSISLTFAKSDELKQEAAVSSNENKQETKVSKEEAKKNQLKTVYSQLGSVYNSVKTSEEKAVISTIRLVVKKMINDLNYPYQNEAAQVKARYSKLSETEKSDVKNAILMNMSTISLRLLNQTFKLL